MKKFVSIVAPTFNEEENVKELYDRVRIVMQSEVNYDYELLIIDNNSSDKTVSILKSIAKKDKRLKVIVNSRNFGHIRSPYWGITQSSGDATIYLASDLQNPPEFIPEFLRHWEQGSKVVLAVNSDSNDRFLYSFLRKMFYKVLDKISDVNLTRGTSGFGLYDRVVIDLVREVNDPYPYLRGLVDEIGYQIKLIHFDLPKRKRGLSKNNFSTVYDLAMLGMVSHSKVPLRIASFLGILIGLFSLLTGFIFLILKILFWDNFVAGIAPFAIISFMFLGVLLISIGILGEYVGSILTYVKNRPIVVEKERINFPNNAKNKL